MERPEAGGATPEEMLLALARRMDAYESHQSRMAQVLDSISNRLQVGSPPVMPPLPASPTRLEDPRIPSPPVFSGVPEACRGFVNQCQIQFEFHPTRFPSERAKVGYIISLLTDEALEWASPLWEKGDPITTDANTFLSSLRQVFDVTGRSLSASSRLLSIKQGNRSVAKYAIEFRTLAVETSWNNESLTAAFLHGLSSQLKDELATKDPPSSLEDLIAVSVKLDNRLQERGAEKRRFSNILLDSKTRKGPSSHSGSPVPVEEPMQLGATRLSREERTRRHTSGLCLYCGGDGHFLRNCPIRPGNFPA